MWDETVRIWELETGQETTSFAHGLLASAGSLAFSPDAKFLAVMASDLFGNGELGVYDVSTGKRSVTREMQIKSEANALVSFSPDGKFLAFTDIGAENKHLDDLQRERGDFNAYDKDTLSIRLIRLTTGQEVSSVTGTPHSLA